MRRLVACVALVLGCTIAAPVGVARAEPPQTHEILTERPSGFWTSNRPAQGGAYRYRLLLVGVGIAAIMGVVVWRVLRNANATRR